MVKLHAGNCLLKPSQRRQLNTWLKRAVQLGQRIGDFLLTITVRRVGSRYEMHTHVHDAAGDFTYRTRGQTWRDVCRDTARRISVALHRHREAIVARAIAA